ncbi:MAG: hypothetical protein V1678_04265 [Candidatus Aenigmatarchaeota archaeon]
MEHDIIWALQNSKKVRINLDSFGVQSVQAGNRLFPRDVAEKSWETKYGAKPQSNFSSYMDFIETTKKDKYNSRNYKSLSA